MATQNVKIFIETDELVTVPDVAKKLKHHFTTIYQRIKKGKLFSFPIHSVDYLYITDIQAFKAKN